MFCTYSNFSLDKISHALPQYTKIDYFHVTYLRYKIIRSEKRIYKILNKTTVAIKIHWNCFQSGYGFLG